MGNFTERMDALIDSAPREDLTARVVVDQVYAKYQELREDLVLHGGGRHHYTRDALYDQTARIMELWTAALVTETGCDLKGATEKVAEMLVTGVYEYAPFEFGDLKASGHGTAEEGGEAYRDYPARVHRLTKDELRAKGDLRRLGFGNDYSDAQVDDALGGVG